MDVSLLIKQRLSELALDQKDLAAAIQVTESYISQLLARKKAPPAPGRTDIYTKMGLFLKLPPGELSKLADLQRQVELKKKAAETPEPLFKDCRDLILRKCRTPEVLEEVCQIFLKEPFGEFERLVTQTLLDVTQTIAAGELENDEWLRGMAQLSGVSLEQVRVTALEFLDSEFFRRRYGAFGHAIQVNLRAIGMRQVLRQLREEGSTESQPQPQPRRVRRPS